MPIPGEPHKSSQPEFTTADGRKVTIKVPGLKVPPVPEATEERGAQEPPRDDPRPPINPHHVGI